jgi:hypothetical protein
VPAQKLNELKLVWSDAIDKGGLFQFNPIFYAVGMKK